MGAEPGPDGIKSAARATYARKFYSQPPDLDITEISYEPPSNVLGGLCYHGFV